MILAKIFVSRIFQYIDKPFPKKNTANTKNIIVLVSSVATKAGGVTAKTNFIDRTHSNLCPNQFTSANVIFRLHQHATERFFNMTINYLSNLIRYSRTIKSIRHVSINMMMMAQTSKTLGCTSTPRLSLEVFLQSIIM